MPAKGLRSESDLKAKVPLFAKNVKLKTLASNPKLLKQTRVTGVL
jgi:hypothetical protein